VGWLECLIEPGIAVAKPYAALREISYRWQTMNTEKPFAWSARSGGAKAYAAWLSSRSGKIYRLLTEAEREYVTRAGSGRPFWWGSSISTSLANYYDQTETDRTGPRQRTVQVGSFAANPWSLYQVHGNVWEWVEDCWNNTYQSAPVDGSAWTSGDCSVRVLRGGSWGSAAADLRAASRIRLTPGSRLFSGGFRLARILDP
jgi:formylglycine-generating enzyme required for sulfatase activity